MNIEKSISRNEENSILIKTQEKGHVFRYLVTKFDENGWAEEKAASPIPFDLVTVKTNTGKEVSAWWDKSTWQSAFLTPRDRVVKWKRRLYEHIT